MPRGAAGRRIAAERRSAGERGEAMALAWYEARGFTCVDRNWRSRNGEIDLIVRRGDLLVVCEVKTRRSDRFGSAVEAHGWRQRRRLGGLVAEWLAAEQPGARRIRLDLAVVDGDGPVRVLEGGLG